MEITAGVHKVDGLEKGQVYLLEEADKLTLFDTGMADSAASILGAIEALGRKPDDVRQIVVSHYHADHIGAAGELADRSGAPVLAHALDAPVVRGDHPLPDPDLSEDERKVFDQITRDVPEAPPTRVDRELYDGDEIDVDGGATVVHVPGHTDGSVALFLPARRVLLCGDAVASVGGEPIVGVFNVDTQQARVSFRKLAELDFDVACFGHGAPLEREASLAFRRAAERLG